MPNAPREGTSNHTYRCDDELWHAAVARAAELGTTVSEVIRDALRRFVGGERYPETQDGPPLVRATGQATATEEPSP